MDNIAQLLALIQLQQQRMQQEQQDQAQLMANLVNQWDQMNVARSVRTVMTNDFFPVEPKQNALRHGYKRSLRQQSLRDGMIRIQGLQRGLLISGKTPLDQH